MVMDVHGRAWRHAFKVLAVKPHAVKLEVPKDGSVPEVLPCGSHLGKVPLLHHTFMILRSCYRMLTSKDFRCCLRMKPTRHRFPRLQPLLSQQANSNDRVVSATRVGRGWQLTVKWKGYDVATAEPHSRVLADTDHPDVLAGIERCKADFYAQNPAAKFADVILKCPLTMQRVLLCLR